MHGALRCTAAAAAARVGGEVCQGGEVGGLSAAQDMMAAVADYVRSELTGNLLFLHPFPPPPHPALTRAGQWRLGTTIC